MCVVIFAESCFPVTDGLYTDQMYEDLTVPVYTTLKGVTNYPFLFISYHQYRWVTLNSNSLVGLTETSSLLRNSWFLSFGILRTHQHRNNALCK